MRSGATVRVWLRGTAPKLTMNMDLDNSLQEAGSEIITLGSWVDDARGTLDTIVYVATEKLELVDFTISRLFNLL